MSATPGLPEASPKETAAKERSIPANGCLLFDVMGLELGESSGVNGEKEEDRGIECPSYQIHCDCESEWKRKISFITIKLGQV